MKLENLREVALFLEEGLDLQRSVSHYTAENYNPKRIGDFVEKLGHPEKKYRVYHVAGSKGKGTVSYALAAILAGSGRKCGLFVSPYVYDFRERFSLAGKFFADDAYVEAARELAELVGNYDFPYGRLTVFEKYLAYALILFGMQNVECAVFETGLGGRLDATNALCSSVQIFTAIELEHTKILGDTVEKIAVEKSKIIKPCSRVFALCNKQSVNDIFRKEAKVRQSKILFFDELCNSFSFRMDKDGESVSVTASDGRSYDYMIHLYGEKLALDTAFALMIASCCGEDVSHYRDSFAALDIPGRSQLVSFAGCQLFLDGAHTRQSVCATCKAFLQLYSSSRKKILVFGCAADKDVRSMAAVLAGNFDMIIIQKPGDFKPSDIDNIYDVFRSELGENSGTELLKYSDISDTVNVLRMESAAVLVTGSFYLVSSLFMAL